MLEKIYGFSFKPQITHNTKQTNPITRYVNLTPLKQDTISFRGMSAPSQYKSVFHYLAADIIRQNSKKYALNGSMLSSNNIATGIKMLFNADKIYSQPTISSYKKIKWKEYVPKDVREYSVNKINEARIDRLNNWKTFLENPESHDNAPANKKLVKNIKHNQAIKLVIWNAINSELKENNRHIPVPLDLQALSETIQGFNKIDPKDRAVRCAAPSFLDIYTHRLRDNLLVEKGLSDNKSVWIKIPSEKHDKNNKLTNINALEILSCKNWCTRSSVDKAEAALEDGDFHIYLERDKNNLWQPIIGMASSGNQIDQIQGIENNNIIPLHQVENIKKYISNNGLKCRSAIVDEGPKAYQQILISDKLKEHKPEFDKNFDKAIKENDTAEIFDYLNRPAEQLKNGKFKIGTYKPSFVANKNSGITIPYAMMGINENKLLKDVQIIDGDMILDEKNPLFSSDMKNFPESLERVTGKIVCSDAQYNKFGNDIRRVTQNNNSKVIVHSK